MWFDPDLTRVSTEVTFWNSAEDGILCGSDLHSAEFRGSSNQLIPRNSAEFRFSFVYEIPYIGCNKIVIKFFSPNIEIFKKFICSREFLQESPKTYYTQYD
jgi:hypothetical protein